MTRLTSIDVVHDEIELVWSLKGEIELDKERMVQFHQDGSLCSGVVKFIALDDGLLIQHLHGIDLTCGLLAHLQHLQQSVEKRCRGYSYSRF